jgi:hypothetical protein
LIVDEMVSGLILQTDFAGVRGYPAINRLLADYGHSKVGGDILEVTQAIAVQPLEGEVRRNEAEIISPLYRATAIAQGVRIVRWELLAPPVRLNRCSTVFDTEKFAAYTLRQLRARLCGDNWGAGNWSSAELIASLERVGVTVELLETASVLSLKYVE